MLTMQLSLNIDANRFIQQIRLQNEMLETEVQKGLDSAFAELAKDGTIENMIKEAIRKNIMDSFSRWIFHSNIRSQVETQITEKLSDKINKYTTCLVSELAEKMNLPND